MTLNILNKINLCLATTPIISIVALSSCSNSPTYVNLLKPYEIKYNLREPIVLPAEEEAFCFFSADYTEAVIQNPSIFSDDIYYTFSTALNNKTTKDKIDRIIKFTKFEMFCSFLGFQSSSEWQHPDRLSLTFKVSVKAAGSGVDLWLDKDKTKKVDNFDTTIDLYFSFDSHWLNNRVSGMFMVSPNMSSNKDISNPFSTDVVCVSPLLAEHKDFGVGLNFLKGGISVGANGTYSYTDATNNYQSVQTTLNDTTYLFCNFNNQEDGFVETILTSSPSFWWLKNIVVDIPVMCLPEDAIDITLPDLTFMYISPYMNNVTIPSELRD